MLEKPKKPKWQIKKGGFDHAWARKRSLNIEEMIKKMQKDKAYMYKVAFELLNTYSDIPWKMGDENMSMLISWVAAQMYNEHTSLIEKPKKDKRRRR